MPLTDINTLNQIGNYSTSGWDLYLMPQLPESLDQFKNSYILTNNNNNNNTSELHYIRPDRTVENVTIVDRALFQKRKNEILLEQNKTYFQRGMEAKLHLTEDDVKTLITSNGGHSPTNKVASDLFQRPEDFKALYEGCDRYHQSHRKKIKQFERRFGELECLKELNKTDPYYFRKALMEYTTKRVQEKGVELKYKVQEPDIRETDPKSAAILLEDLLGKEGVALYCAALQEEANDKEFRKAVFCNSATHFEGAEWNERPVVIVSGPSASGKSFAAKAAVKESLAFLATKQSSNSPQGNYVIAVDGGVIREVSQIRKWINKQSNELGYPGVKDLHDRSQILETVKKHVLQQSLDLKHLGVVIPETFSKWYVPFNNAKKMMNKIIGLDNTRAIFVRVVGEDPSLFQKVVAYMGSSRAWKSFTGDEKAIDRDNLSYKDLNSKEGLAESKSYGPRGFKFGVIGSSAAEKWFIENSKENLRMIITNDLILAKPKDINNPEAGWTINAEPNDKGVIKLPKRAYNEWVSHGSQGSLEEYYQRNSHNYETLIKTSFEIDLEKCIAQIEKLTKSRFLNDDNQVKLSSLKKNLEELKSITQIPVEQLSFKNELIEELRLNVSSKRKWFFFETDTQKIFNQALYILEDAINAKSNQSVQQTAISAHDDSLDEVAVESISKSKLYRVALSSLKEPGCVEVNHVLDEQHPIIMR